MTYGEIAQKRYGQFYYAYLRGWRRDPLPARASERETQAYTAGRADRAESVHYDFAMLTET